MGKCCEYKGEKMEENPRGKMIDKIIKKSSFSILKDKKEKKDKKK